MRKYSVVDEEGVVRSFTQNVGDADHSALNDAIDLAQRAGEDVVEHLWTLREGASRARGCVACCVFASRAKACRRRVLAAKSSQVKSINELLCVR